MICFMAFVQGKSRHHRNLFKRREKGGKKEKTKEEEKEGKKGKKRREGKKKKGKKGGKKKKEKRVSSLWSKSSRGRLAASVAHVPDLCRGPVIAGGIVKWGVVGVRVVVRTVCGGGCGL